MILYPSIVDAQAGTEAIDVVEGEIEAAYLSDGEVLSASTSVAGEVHLQPTGTYDLERLRQVVDIFLHEAKLPPTEQLSDALQAISNWQARRGLPRPWKRSR